MFGIKLCPTPMDFGYSGKSLARLEKGSEMQGLGIQSNFH